jgi:hypothetical protein
MEVLVSLFSIYFTLFIKNNDIETMKTVAKLQLMYLSFGVENCIS